MPARVAVLGAGNGGCAIAADLVRRGIACTLFDLPAFEAALAPLPGQQGHGKPEQEPADMPPIGHLCAADVKRVENQLRSKYPEFLQKKRDAKPDSK
jgi:3-hydroxyisobutyrate dehydrogenase-like beta-hydroxyacid dehydrogenase